jgi:hypothetical protein
MARRLEEAEADFSATLKLEPGLYEAWKRRGQTRAALGKDREAVEDLTQAIDGAVRAASRLRPPPPPSPLRVAAPHPQATAADQAHTASPPPSAPPKSVSD